VKVKLKITERKNLKRDAESRTLFVTAPKTKKLFPTYDTE
jgi:hypothetical protein